MFNIPVNIKNQPISTTTEAKTNNQRLYKMIHFGNGDVRPPRGSMWSILGGKFTHLKGAFTAILLHDKDDAAHSAIIGSVYDILTLTATYPLCSIIVPLANHHEAIQTYLPLVCTQGMYISHTGGLGTSCTLYVAEDLI